MKFVKIITSTFIKIWLNTVIVKRTLKHNNNNNNNNNNTETWSCEHDVVILDLETYTDLLIHFVRFRLGWVRSSIIKQVCNGCVNRCVYDINLHKPTYLIKPCVKQVCVCVCVCVCECVCQWVNIIIMQNRCSTKQVYITFTPAKLTSKQIYNKYQLTGVVFKVCRYVAITK